MDQTIEIPSAANPALGLIEAMKKVRGSAWLGKINGVGRRTLWEWDGDALSAVGADFLLPRYDAELDALLVARYRAEYKGVEHDVKWVKAILDTIEQLDGQLLYNQLSFANEAHETRCGLRDARHKAAAVVATPPDQIAVAR
jgi:hypothetical protein